MENSLSGLERDLVLQTLQNNESNIIITALTEQLTPLTLNNTNYTLLKEGIILVKKNLNEKLISQFTDKLPVKVFFYYKGRGLYFLTQLRFVKVGLAFVIPTVIYKQPDVSNLKNSKLSCTLYFSSNQKSGINIVCYPLDAFPLLNKNINPDVVPDEEINDAQKLLSVDWYFKDKSSEPSAVESRVAPLTVLFLSEKQIVFGCSQKDMMLQLGVEYGIKLSIPLDIGYREIYSTIKVSRISGNADDVYDVTKTCAICNFTQIKKEDSRFLFEKLYGTVFSR